MMTQKRSNEVFGGTFLIGLAVLFLLNWWWPGIMFVIGIAFIAKALAEGRGWMSEPAGLICIGIGIVFGFFSINWWPLILIAIGLYLLFGNRRANWGSWGKGNFGASGEAKSKRDDLV